MSDAFRIGSLFSGIGGLERRLELAGLGPTLWQIEIDDYCRRVLAKHWPHAKRYEDVRTITQHDLEPVDLFVGGFPCQDVSTAGAGRGLAGERSGLWREFLRLVDECRPPWVLIENVAHGRGRWLPEVRRGLCDLGYSSRAFQISAAECGAPHLRRRVFVLASAHPERESLWELAERRPARRQRSVRGEREALALDLGEATRWPALPSICRSDDGVSRRLDGARLKALGNAVSPACSEVIGKMLITWARARALSSPPMDQAEVYP